MPKNLSRLVLKGAIGFLIGLAVWGGLSGPYTRLLAVLSQAAVRVGEAPAVTYITPRGSLMVVDRTDFPPTATSLRLAVESTDISFNFILLVALFAAASRTFSDRNVAGFAGAAIALVFVHVFAVVSFVEAHYAVSYGSWSATHYGFVARHFWEAAPYFYSVVGSYGFAISLWWLFRDQKSEVRNQKEDARKQRTDRRKRKRDVRKEKPEAKRDRLLRPFRAIDSP